MSQPAFAVRPRARGAARLARVGALGVLSLCCGLMSSMAGAQETGGAGGAIVIPGPGEKNPAALAEMASRVTNATPSNAAASSSAAPVAMAASVAPRAEPPLLASPAARAASGTDDRFAQAANANGAIVIPGPGDAAAAPAIQRASFNPNARPYAASANLDVNANPAGTMRANLPATANAASNDPRAVMPVVVAPATAQGAMRAAPVAANPPRAALPVQTMQNAALNRQAALQRQPAQPVQQAAPQQNAAQPAPATQAGMQDGESIRAAALAFLQQQAAGLPGKVEITVAPVFPRGLAACTTLAPFMPTGARLWGRTTVGMRCAGERPWTLYLQAKVAIHATYYLASRALSPGDVLAASDLVARDGDLTMLPMAIVTDPSQAVGAVALTRVAAGLPLRQDMLRGAASVAIGQTVRVVAQGQGFAISSEGSAMNNAGPGQQVRVKTASGQIVSGIVKDGSTVEIQL